VTQPVQNITLYNVSDREERIIESIKLDGRLSQIQDLLKIKLI